MVTVVIPEGNFSTKLPTSDIELEDSAVVVVVAMDVDDEVTGGFSI